MLAAPFPMLLMVGAYARSGPWLFGFPFFYWYQFMWVFLSVGLTWCAYRILNLAGERRAMPGDPR